MSTPVAQTGGPQWARDELMNQTPPLASMKVGDQVLAEVECDAEWGNWTAEAGGGAGADTRRAIFTIIRRRGVAIPALTSTRNGRGTFGTADDPQNGTAYDNVPRVHIRCTNSATMAVSGGIGTAVSGNGTNDIVIDCTVDASGARFQLDVTDTVAETTRVDVTAILNTPARPPAPVDLVFAA